MLRLALLGFYSYYLAVYIYHAIKYSFGNNAGKDKFPVVTAKGGTIREQATRLWQVVLFGIVLVGLLWFYPIYGMYLALALSIYEVKLGYSFYRMNMHLNENMNRHTLHCILIGLISMNILT